MTAQLEYRIREAVAQLAYAVDEPQAFGELVRPMTAMKASPRQRSILVLASATVIALLLIGVPLMALRDDAPVPTTIAPPATDIPITTGMPTPTTELPRTSSPPSTVAADTNAMAGFDVAAQAGVQGRAFGGAVGSDGALLSIDLKSGPKALAWDGADGLVYLTEDEELRWITPRDDVAVAEFGAAGPGAWIGVRDVVAHEGRPTVAISGLETSVTWFDLTTGDRVEGPSDRFVDGRITVGGITVYIEEPDWADVARGEGGEPLPPFALPHLVVQGDTGVEPLLRFEVGNEDRPFALIHDFDGRRLIYSVEPYEPALPPRTVFIVDLECLECTEVIESDGSAVWFDLVGQSAPTPPPTDVTSGISNPIDLTGLDWIAAGVNRRVRGIPGRTIRDGSKSVAWDGDDGVVYVTTDQELRWITPEFHRMVRTLDPIGGDQYPDLLDVVVVDGRPLAALSTSDTTPEWIDLATGRRAVGPVFRFSLGDRYEITVDGRTAYIEEASPGTAAELVVLAEGAEVLRREIGTRRRPDGRLHDFDGRRIIYSTLGGEPALGFHRIVVLDLDCPTCTQIMYSGSSSDWFDLVGQEPVQTGPPTCSTSGLATTPTLQPDLPPAVAEMRRAILDAAVTCDFIRLIDLAEDGFPFEASVGMPEDWIEAERLFAMGESGGAPVLAQLVEYLNGPFRRSSGVVENYVWSGDDSRSDPTGVVIDPDGEWLGFIAEE